MTANVSFGVKGLDPGDQGMTVWDRARVTVRPSDNLSEQFDTLLHEVLHLILDDCDSVFSADLGGKTKEDIISEMTPRLVEFLVVPWVIEDLQAAAEQLKASK